MTFSRKLALGCWNRYFNVLRSSPGAQLSVGCPLRCSCNPKVSVMPIATPKQYAAMLDAAQAAGYAYAGINVSSLVTLNGALKGFADKKSDGLVQLSTGAGEFISGLNVKDMAMSTSYFAASR